MVYKNIEIKTIDTSKTNKALIKVLGIDILFLVKLFLVILLKLIEIVL
jgi:hypothetical protein